MQPKVQGDQKKTETIKILLTPTKIQQTSSTLLVLKFILRIIIPQSFSQWSPFARKLCYFQNMLQMTSTLLEANSHTPCKIVKYSNTSDQNKYSSDLLN